MNFDLDPDWEFVADRVMGGVSQGSLSRETIAGRPAVRLTGRVSLENDGGFLQMAFDVPKAGPPDLSTAQGVRIDVFGNGEKYDLRLRTDALAKPWQSFRQEFSAPANWQTLKLPFDGFAPNKTDKTFDPSGLRRVGIVAVGRVFDVDIAVARIGFYG